MKIKICKPLEHKFLQYKYGKEDLICMLCWRIYKLQKKRLNKKSK